MDFAGEVSDQVIFMADGHIIEQGASKDRFSVIRTRTKSFIGQFKK